MLENLKRWDVRDLEYKVATAAFKATDTVLDVACGTGTFMAQRSGPTIGIDINPDNVDYCQKRGLDARIGNALKLDFPDASLDGVHCSHLIQVFMPNETVACIREFRRVLKPGGRLVITTLTDFHNFYQHPENARPYPLDALMRLTQTQSGATSPMWQDPLAFDLEKAWFRKEPLVYFRSNVLHRLAPLFQRLNKLQRFLGIVKPFTADSYTATFIKR